MHLIYETPIHLTQHAQARMRQRGFSNHDIHWFVAYGTPVRDGFLLTRKDVTRSRSEAGNDVQRLDHLIGTFVVAIEGMVCSVYRAGKRKLRFLMANSR